MRAIVLAAGRGRRLQASDPSVLSTPAQREAAARGLKVMMPVGTPGRPWLDFVLQRLADAGCTSVVLVVPPAHETVAAHLEAAAPPLPVSLAVQPTPTGTAGAVAAAAARIDGGEFLVVNGDNLYPMSALRALLAAPGWGLAAFTRRSLEQESGFAPARVAAFAMVTRDALGRLTGIVEKPPVETLTPDALVSMNLWRFDTRVFDACRAVPPSSRGEYELPAAVLLAARAGLAVRVVPVEGAVLDLTTAADVPAVTRAIHAPEVRR